MDMRHDLFSAQGMVTFPAFIQYQKFVTPYPASASLCTAFCHSNIRTSADTNDKSSTGNRRYRITRVRNSMRIGGCSATYCCHSSGNLFNHRLNTRYNWGSTALPAENISPIFLTWATVQISSQPAEQLLSATSSLIRRTSLHPLYRINIVDWDE